MSINIYIAGSNSAIEFFTKTVSRILADRIFTLNLFDHSGSDLLINHIHTSRSATPDRASVAVYIDRVHINPQMQE